MTHGILFDLDETLIDRAASIVHYARRFHSDFSNAIAQACERFVGEFVRLDGNGYVDRATFFDNLARHLSTPQISPKAIAAHFAENAWKTPRLMLGAKEGLLKLRAAGIPVGIVTNGGSRNQRMKLANTGLDKLVDHIVISEEFGAKKPNPAVFLSTCETLQINPTASWFVGDNPALDIVGAGAVGLRTIWLRRTMPWPAGQPECYTHSVHSLPEAFNAMRSGARVGGAT
jgi:putative hydrolase of the HAD superfamily